MGNPNPLQDQKRKTEAQEQRTVESTLETAAVQSDPVVLEAREVEANPLYADAVSEEQIIPVSTAPAEKQKGSAKKMSRKKEEKLEAERQKEAQRLREQERKRAKEETRSREAEEKRVMDETFDQLVRAPMLQEIQELCDWARAYEQHCIKNDVMWKYTNQVEYIIEVQNYGTLVEARSNLSALSQVPKKRRMEFNAAHPNHIGGNSLSRDATEFLPVDATDEQILQTVEDLRLIGNRLPSAADEPEAHAAALAELNAAKTRIASLFSGYYEKVYNMVLDSGVQTEAPFRCKEEVVSRAIKVADIFRFVQVGTFLNKHLAGLVPPEQRAFISAIYEYSKELTQAAGAVFSSDPFLLAQVERQLEAGDLYLSTIHDRRMADTLEYDEKAKAGV